MGYPAHIDPVEEEIIDRLIHAILARGWMVSVYDGEEFALRRSSDRAAIAPHVAATEETTLIIEAPNRHRVGWIWLIHGNGHDVIADYTDPLAALLGKVLTEPQKESTSCPQ